MFSLWSICLSFGHNGWEQIIDSKCWMNPAGSVMILQNWTKAPVKKSSLALHEQDLLRHSCYAWTATAKSNREVGRWGSGVGGGRASQVLLTLIIDARQGGHRYPPEKEAGPSEEEALKGGDTGQFQTRIPENLKPAWWRGWLWSTTYSNKTAQKYKLLRLTLS